jgi:hypothetical protein
MGKHLAFSLSMSSLFPVNCPRCAQQSSRTTHQVLGFTKNEEKLSAEARKHE